MKIEDKYDYEFNYKALFVVLVSVGLCIWFISLFFQSSSKVNLDVGYDLDCSDIGEQVWVGNYDPHGLDRDGDGWGCESYGG